MTSKELALAADLLDQAADRFGNDTCTDWEFPAHWSDNERQAFVKEYHEYNGDPEEYDPLRAPWLDNFCAMGLLAEKLRRAS